MDKNQIIDNMNNTILYKLKPSKIHGIGLHSIKDIPANTIIIKNITPIIGYHYTKKEIQKLNPEIKTLCENYFNCKDDKTIFIPQDPSVLSSFYLPNYFLNHSNNPNVKNENHSIISIKNIKQNEEITINYEKYFSSLFKKLNFKKTHKKKLY
jgi:hypothetical protein